jgi:predicted transcriptional regulator YdeE
MQKIIEILPEKRFIGISVRTNNQNESDQTQAKIGSTFQKYFQNRLSDKIIHRKNPGVTFCIYTDYESDVNGDYTCLIGEEVNSFEEMDEENYDQLFIPEQTYAKFTSNPGKMPEVCIDMWKEIWQMKSIDFSEQRSYIADFEVYDERSIDPANAVLDIFIGLRNR